MSSHAAVAVARSESPSISVQPPARRIEAIQGLRGLAAFMVCWFHFTNGNPAFLPPGILKSSGTLGGLGVEIFFVISGFIVPYSLYTSGYVTGLANYGRFLWKRISRLDPPYLASIALVIVLQSLSELTPGFRGTPVSFSFTQVALHLGYLNTFFHKGWLNPVYWTLAIEFQYYLLIGLIFPALISRRWWIRSSAVVVLGSLALSIHQSSFLFVYLFLFVMGFTAFQYRTGVIGRAELGCVLAAAFAGCWFTMDGIISGLGLATCGAILMAPGSFRPLNFLGQISYSLYLVHVPVGGRIINLGERAGGGLAVKVLFIALACAVSIAAAYALYRWVEMPFQRYATGIRFRRAQ